MAILILACRIAATDNMPRLICENCDHGYTPNATSCPWCGASSTLAHMSDETAEIDTECYVDYWLARFSTGETFQCFAGHPLDTAGLIRALSRYRVVTFNGQHYDMPVITVALVYPDPVIIKQASDAIINENLRSWDLLKRYGLQSLEWVDHIDLFDVTPGQASLKMYGARMHTRKIQDLPYSPDERIDWPRRVMLREYCGNDLTVTRELRDTFAAQIKLREDMSAEYGVDLRSKSDAQIAEVVMRSLLPFKPERPNIPPGSTFCYRPPAWLRFQTPALACLLHTMSTVPFVITYSGGVAPGYANRYVDWGDKAERLDPHGRWIKRPADWMPTPVSIGASSYTVGIGGLHSNESCRAVCADAGHSLTDHDVASYYPSLILRTGIAPAQIGEAFISIYRGWYDRRLAAKHGGDKKTANSLKTLLNGTFGKLGSIWSIFYAPSEMIQVTVTGQLALLMLIETLEVCGIPVVSANTDGIVIRCPRALEWLRDQIIRDWEATTGFETERADYRLLASRDVNSYVALPLDPTKPAKLKGEYAPPEPGPSGWPNPTGQVCVDAIVAYLRDGVPLADTVAACHDVRRFVYVRQVKGGGRYAPSGTLPKTTTQKRMRELCGPIADKAELIAAYERERATRDAQQEYLGKVVRWYYAAGSQACIVTPQGGLVARTEGCRPLMELPDTVPADLDRAWYVTEARAMLDDMGIA